MVEIEHEGGPGEQTGDRNRTCTGLDIRRLTPQLRLGDFDWRRNRRGSWGKEVVWPVAKTVLLIEARHAWIVVRNSYSRPVTLA